MTRKAAYALVGLLAIGACQSTSGITIDQGADGSTMTMKVGETLEVALVGNPSTGYIWEPVGLDESILQWTGVRRFEPDSTLVGAPGTIRLTFEALAPGTLTLELVYHRSFETADPAGTFTVTLHVEE
ncbi:MAG: protease inhibitor I42 family protein [Acidimicrobiia bacterium]|nr:protease inhibitor I42 family protein [Acidimicrobiia bacterium]